MITHRTRTRARTRALLSSLVGFGACAGGCNAILDNTPATSLVTTEAGTEPAPLADGGPTQEPNVSNDDGAAPEDAGQVQSPGCAAGQRMCAGTCVSLADPLYGCGSPTCEPCEIAHATSACAGGACAVASCDPGYADCNAMPADGCEGDLSRATSCGTCNTVCAAAAPLCAPVDGAGSFQCSTGCTPAAPLLCGAACVDPATSVDHCGGCNVTCPAVANATIACTAGACTFTCKASFHACGAACASNTAPATCGASCTPCPAPPNAQASCVAGACGGTCKAGFGDCDANMANGCEAALATDPANCGTCGKACAPGGSCKAGVCQAPPDGG